ncbi:MAG TPA: type II secretion system minor pseudopilin GspJ [Gallionellaceae bacterium]
MNATRARGFTLVELLVALFVLAILTVAGFSGLNAVQDTRKAVESETRKWQGLMFFFSRMEQDIALAVKRPVRDRAGLTQPEWVGLSQPVSPDDAQLTLTRAGVQDEQGAQVGPQRIGYRLEHGTVYLLRWMALDQPADAEPRRYALLQGVSEFNLRYMSADGQWNRQWPLQGQDGGIPLAVEVQLTLDGGKQITRLFLTR